MASIDHTRVQPPQRRLGSKDPRVTSSQAINFHESSWRAHRCTKCKRQEHKCLSPPLSNSNKATNAYGGIREEEQTYATNANVKSTSAQILHSQIPPQATNDYGGRREEEHQIPPKSRSKGFPSLRGEIDWWKGGSRSPLSFPLI